MVHNNQKYKNGIVSSYDGRYSRIIARDIRVLRAMGGNMRLATI
jgi:hypothetical protein